VKFLKKLADPAALGDDMSNRTVLSLSAGPGHRGLALRGPRDQIVAKEDAEAGGGASGVWAASPVGVGIAGETVDGAGANVVSEPEVSSSNPGGRVN
jgi:hypothetical protein